MSAPEPAVEAVLARAVARVDAPDAVIAVTRAGRHTLASAGGATERAGHRDKLRYELGSVSKTYTGLLLAVLAREGTVGLDDPITAHLPHPASRRRALGRITLRHLATHTAGFHRIPPDLLALALTHPGANVYTGYGAARLLRALARAHPRHRPGTRWRYSNFGAALLGPALAHAAGTDYPALLTHRVLDPLGLDATGLAAAGDGADAPGFRGDGHTPAPAADMGGFAAAGSVRATPADTLRFLEAHLSPGRTPLTAALTDVQVPQLRRGATRAHTHTLTWFQHPAPGGPLLFHAGETLGQQAFCGYHPATGTGLAAFATRRGRHSGLVDTAYGALYELAGTAD
ncbi:serine hydrolase domain-containing protein [Streptomyces sp. NPDC050560]|uniref:serine hydrolase domain-containing protein n=1 Tax=Streptomyces sp. NPDC050560 TaxID=3365630 RepID=UPI00378B3568